MHIFAYFTVHMNSRYLYEYYYAVDMWILLCRKQRGGGREQRISARLAAHAERTEIRIRVVRHCCGANCTEGVYCTKVCILIVCVFIVLYNCCIITWYTYDIIMVWSTAYTTLLYSHIRTSTLKLTAVCCMHGVCDERSASWFFLHQILYSILRTPVRPWRSMRFLRSTMMLHVDTQIPGREQHIAHRRFAI